jgi:glycosyltransferase involved in cell wall biosynthesis
MKILLLSRYDRLGASSRVRSYQYIPLLRTFGIDVEVAPLLSEGYLRRLYAHRATDWRELFLAYLSRAARLFRADRFDLLWIEKELFPNLPASFEQILAGLGIPYVVDYDDAIFDRYRLSPNPLKRLLAHKIEKVVRYASLVICGNSYLAEYAQRAGARRVEVLPTVVDLDRYSVSRSRGNARIVVVWIGTPNTARYLDIAMPALRLASKEYSLQLRVIGAQFRASGLDVECQEWSEKSEVSNIQGCAIGIMPLLDTPWERGKCGYKLIQYMACGLPVIASPVGVNSEIVMEDVNGFLPSTPQEWLSALRVLCGDEQQRMRMGMHGRRSVENNYCLQVTAPKLVQLLSECKSSA